MVLPLKCGVGYGIQIFGEQRNGPTLCIVETSVGAIWWSFLLESETFFLRFVSFA